MNRRIRAPAAPTRPGAGFQTIGNWVLRIARLDFTVFDEVRADQTATVEIDTYPGVVCDAKVQSLSPGTGLTFSLLPPENATGNWVKVVQRLPVRLALESTEPNLPLHAGLSATVEVDTEYRRPWLAWLDRTASRLFGTAHAGEQHR